MARPARRFLDHAAGSPLVGPALAAMAEVWELAGNPSSLHASGRALRRHLEQARESVAADLGAHPTEVVFCSGGTEANNLALLGSAGAAGEVLVSAVEHPSISESHRLLGDRVRVLEVDADGRVDPAVGGPANGPAPPRGGAPGRSSAQPSVRRPVWSR